MRYALLALALIAPPALAQNTAGTQSDVTSAVSLDLTASCPSGTATAQCPAGSVYELPIGNGQGVVAVDVVGLTGSGATVAVERTVGGLWTSRNLLVTGSAGAFAPSVSSDASFTVNTVGSRAIRFRVTVAGTGSARLYASATANSSVIQFGTSLPAGNLTIGKTILSDGAATSGLQQTQTDRLQSILNALTAPLAISNTQFGVTQVGAPWSFTLSGTPTVNANVTFPAAQAVTDNGGSLTIDTPQMPTSLGPKAGVASLSVTLPSDQPPLAIYDRGSPAWLTSQVTLSTSAIQVAPARTGRRSVALIPTAQATYYVCATQTTTTTACAPLLGGIVATLPTQAAVYAFVPSGTLSVGVMEFNN